MIFNIQRFSIHDGSGIRTVVFYKGCPLRCQWCSNPESQSFGYSIMYDSRRCRSFGDCIKQDPLAITRDKGGGVIIEREKISSLDELSEVCAARALTISGRHISLGELMTEIEKDRPFYMNDGGVTLSGGEPLSQGGELTRLLERLKSENIPVAIETSLHAGWNQVERCIGLATSFLVDLKHLDKDKFRAYTGGDADLVKENLMKLTEKETDIIIRIPVIPGFNHSDEEMRMMIDFVTGLKNIHEIHFLPYHTLGIEKYKMLGMNYIFESRKAVHDSELAEYARYAISKGFIVKTGG